MASTTPNPIPLIREPSSYTDSVFDDSDRERDDHVLQIVFDPKVQANRRRKSSLVSSEFSRQAASSSCFVHALLETAKNHDSEKVIDGADGALAKVAKKIGPHERIKDCSTFPNMTKVELGDMVLGVRELSKHLASLSIKMKVRSVFVLTKAYDHGLVSYTRTLAKWLLEKGYTVYVEDTLEREEEFNAAGLLGGDPIHASKLHYWTPELCQKKPQLFDFIVTLGGDGTVLYASWLFQKVVPPVFSFALGSLGFLTQFDFSNFERCLTRTFSEGVTVGLRLRFEGTIMRAQPTDTPIRDRDLGEEILGPENEPTHRRDESHVILNEVVVDRGPNPTMSATELYGDNIFLTNVAADGVCIATPTGSTAYNLAAGGSLCHPEIPGMLVSVIAPHSLSFRPVILPDSMILRIGVPFDARTTAWVSFDGKQRVELRQGDYVTVIASRFPFPMVQSKTDNRDWIDSLRRTMNWGSRQRQKALDSR